MTYKLSVVFVMFLVFICLGVYFCLHVILNFNGDVINSSQEINRQQALKNFVVKFKNQINKTASDVQLGNVELFSPLIQNSQSSVDYNTHIFYYIWYGNEKFNKKYIHWNHNRIPHWNKIKANKWSQSKHYPPADIASSYYPKLGPYSSRSRRVIENHMQQLVNAKIGVIVVSWYPYLQADDSGEPVDHIMPQLLDIANNFSVKVVFHIEPFKGRNATTLRQQIIYVIDTYGSHPAFYHTCIKNKCLPMFYIYDSYHTPPKNWHNLLSVDGSISVRGTKYDAWFIGLVVTQDHLEDMITAGFDGFYTYFATDKFTFGSNYANWNYLAMFAQKQNLIFIPSIGPGYIDTEVRPWNKENTRDRHGGSYYISAFKHALSVKILPKYISITSFNEWHEGTQIEEAVPKLRTLGQPYLNYHPKMPDFYLSLTRKYVNEYRNLRKQLNSTIK